MKRTIIKTIALSLTLLLSTTGVFAAVPGDVKGQSYEAAVSALMDKGIITGDTNGSFNPDTKLTRAQACVIIVKSMNAPATEVNGTATQPASKSGFGDMTGYGWADGYVAYAVKHGVTKGYPDGTFKPGNSVTTNELITMVLRAAAYSDDTLGGTWPSNYIAKATELNLLTGLPETLPANATKWMAAQLDFNALDQIEKANPQQEEESPSQSTPTGVPDTSSMTYATGSFNTDMTTFNGKTLSDGVVIYTYGQKSSYTSSMTFSKTVGDYRQDTIYKYKGVETPAFYKVENGQITEMVLPKDVGFSGYAYVVINGTFSTTNAKGETIKGVETLVAGESVKWLCEKGITPPSKDEYLKGTLYELSLKNGTVKSINKTDTFKGKVFTEISGSDYAEITSFNDNVVTTDTGDMIEIKNNATVYAIDKSDLSEYNTGKQSNIKKGNEIRAYDISDDDEAAADIVVILKTN